MKKLCRGIIEKILSGEIQSRDELDRAKRELSIELKMDKFIRNSEILKYAKNIEREKLLGLLQKKPTRTMSGVAVVAAMTRPHSCPHGKCKYCPGGPPDHEGQEGPRDNAGPGGSRDRGGSQDNKGPGGPKDNNGSGGQVGQDIGVPQSYTGKEPATRRAIRYGYNPFLQVTFRLSQLRDIGHPVDKVELIVMGGTLTAQCLDYQEWFVKESLRAMNEFEENYRKIKKIGEEEFIRKYNESEKKFSYLEDIQEGNEKSRVRCVGMTFEPRPDWAKKDEIDNMLNFGVTRVEIGVQNPSDQVYKLVDRGHTVQDVVEATQQLKDSGLKVGYHIMPGILGYNPDLDMGAFEKIFGDERFMPDMVKI